MSDMRETEKGQTNGNGNHKPRYKQRKYNGQYEHFKQFQTETETTVKKENNLAHSIITGKIEVKRNEITEDHVIYEIDRHSYAWYTNSIEV